MSRKTNRDAFAKLDRIYARLPAVKCKGLCFHACGPVPMTLVEADRLRASAHREPHIHADKRCSLLTEGGRCSAYAARPLICRAFGVVKRMSCMHGCLPDRWLSDHEFVEIGREVERVGGRLVVTTPEGVVGVRDSFLDIDTTARPVVEVDADAERTRVLRILHGGRIVAVTRRGPGGFIDIDRRDDDEGGQ